MSLDFESFPKKDGIVNVDSLPLREQRSLVFIILYAIESLDYDVSLEAVLDNISRGFFIDIPHENNVFKMAQSIVVQRDEIDEQIKPFLAHWRLERVGICTRLILRLAVWEFQNTDTPSTVVINEAVELAKNFAELEAYKFINGVLDEFVKKAEHKKEE